MSVNAGPLHWYLHLPPDAVLWKVLIDSNLWQCPLNCCCSHLLDSMSIAQTHAVWKIDSQCQLSCRVSSGTQPGLPTAPGDPAFSSTIQGEDQEVSEVTEGMSSEGMQRGAAGSRPEWQADSVGKLFDKELDNHHEEGLLLAQVTTGLSCDLPVDSLRHPC